MDTLKNKVRPLRIPNQGLGAYSSFRMKAYIRGVMLPILGEQDWLLRVSK